MLDFDCIVGVQIFVIVDWFIILFDFENVVFIVQGCVGNNYIIDCDWFQFGNWCQCVGVVDLDFDVVQDGLSLFGGKFVCNCLFW